MTLIIKVLPNVITFRIRVDYSSLSENLKELDEHDEIKRKSDKLQKAINTLQNTVDKIQAPNMRVTTFTNTFFTSY